MISLSQRPLTDNRQHLQQTNIHIPGGIRTCDRSRLAAVDLRLRPRGYWDVGVYCVKLILVYCVHLLVPLFYARQIMTSVYFMQILCMYAKDSQITLGVSTIYFWELIDTGFY